MAVWGSQHEAFEEIEEIERHTTGIFPDDTALTCTLTAGGGNNAWSEWAEIVDSAGNGGTLSSKFASYPGYITAMLVEIASVASKLFMVEIAYGEAKTVVSRHRILTETNKLPTAQSPRVRGAKIPAGETVYYQCKSNAGGENIVVHFRYYLCL